MKHILHLFVSGRNKLSFVKYQLSKEQYKQVMSLIDSFSLEPSSASVVVL